MDVENGSFAPEARRLEKVLNQANVENKTHIFGEEHKLVHAFNISGRYKESQEVRDEIFTFFGCHIQKNPIQQKPHKHCL